MGGTGDWDIESYRSFYESDEHWALKKEFMETHYDALPEDRLVCLAQVYANIELLGCRYPAKVMEEVSYLARGVGLEYKERKKTKLQRTFVKASDAAGAKVRGPKGQKRKNPDETAPHEPLHKKKVAFVKSQSSSNEPLASKPVAFVKAESTAREPASSPIMSFIKSVRDDNASEEGEVTDDPESDRKESMSVDKCMSFIKSIRGGESECSSIKSSAEQRDLADKYRKATQQNVRQRITYSDKEPDTIAVGRGLGRGSFRTPRGKGAPGGGQSRDEGKYAAHLAALMRSTDPLCDFILVQRVYANTDNPSAILEQSANFSHMPLDCSYDQNGHRCRISINGINVASARAENKKASKDAAAIKALEILIKRCFTLRILKLHSSVEEVSLSEVSSENSASSRLTSKHGSSEDTPIDDSSIGSKLLKMMGWAGGGLGKDGSGISEPIKPQHVFGRTGLGHEGEQGVTKVFKTRIRGMLQDYLRGSDMSDLAFSPLFSKEQRAEIHKMARTMKLKSHSHGKGENRFLVISRKFSPKQLLYRLLQEGPTDKYELVAPGEN
ncbi:uncharacterized protein [Macrobrachium rosenbergii]|uniref:uncharacterized protein n=1 Tax=Macrobrachium rosenbergii TaxID=79674 RepID=UPI0034D3EDA0